MRIKSLFGRSPQKPRPADRREHSRLHLESLEDRKVLAAYINEAYLDPPGSGGDLRHEYVELRGTPSMSLDDHYLIVLENENDALDTGNPGTVDFIFDLDGLTMGTNGFLTFRQQSEYIVALGTTDLVDASGDSNGWGGDATTLPVQAEFDAVLGGQGNKLENSGGTYMLIHTIGVAPTIGMNLDVGHDGLDVPTGHADWTILDAIGIYSEFGEAQYGRLYAQVNFGPETNLPGNPDNVEPGATFTALGYEIEYFGRYGNSTGQTSADWHISNLTDNPLAGYTANDDFRQSGEPHGSPTFVETNQGVPYGTNLTDTLGAPNYPGVVDSTVAGRHIFYNNSSFDGNSTSINASDDGAIAPDKNAYFPNGTLVNFDSVTSYTRGINGIMLDLSTTGGTHASITASDFVFKVGNNNSPSTWAAAPAPSAVSVRMGVSGVDRVEITWADGAIKNQWLEVQALATASTGLAATDVFFWGNKIGDIGGGTSTAFSVLVTTDVAGIQANLGGGSTITNLYDIDRSGAVLVTTDRATALANVGSITRINITGGPFAPEGGGIASALAASSGSATSSESTLPTSVAARLESASSGPAVVNTYYEQVAAAADSDAALDEDSDDSGVDDELLDSLVSGLAM